VAATLSSVAVEFLDSPGRFAVVATINDDGAAHQAVVWYARRGDTVLVNAREGRRWAANVKRLGSISLAVADGYDYVILSGPVDVIEDPDLASADIRSLALRYGDDEGQFNGQRRLSFVLHPEHVALHGRLLGR
jgi:PPOX class probable F420-dependent enzyme